MKNKIKNLLLKEAEKDYKKFSASLIPNIDNVLGVRLPRLREIAKEVYKSENWQSFVNSNEEEFMEETMLKGFVIGLIKAPPEEILEYVKNFVPRINNWSVCDSFCASLKFANKNQALVWDFIQPYLDSEKEFEIRFALVMMLNFFINEDYILKVLSSIDRVKSEDYYAKMAAAWTLSICFIKFPTETRAYLSNSNLSDWTFNKALQKCLESYRISPEVKEELKNLKR